MDLVYAATIGGMGIDKQNGRSKSSRKEINKRRTSSTSNGGMQYGKEDFMNTNQHTSTKGLNYFISVKLLILSPQSLSFALDFVSGKCSLFGQFVSLGPV